MLKKFIEKLKHFFRFPVFNYTLFGFLFLSVFLILLTISSYNIIKSQKIKEAEVMALSTSENARQFINGIYFKGNALVNEAQVEIVSQKINEISRSQILFDKIQNDNSFEILAEINKEGSYIANSEWIKRPEMQAKQVKSTVGDRDYFKDLKSNQETKVVLSDPVKSRSTGNWVIVLAIKKLNLHKEFDGIFLITISLKNLSETFAKLNPNPNATIALYNNENVLVSRFPFLENKIGKNVNLSKTFGGFDDKIVTREICPIENIPKVFGATRIKDLHLITMWGIPYEKVVSQVQGQYIVFGTIELIIILISLIFLYFKYLNLVKLEALQVNEINNAKLALIGEFASGLAHEINNPLTVIMGNAKALLGQKYQKDILNPECNEKLHKILDTSERINKIIKSLKNLGHSPIGDSFAPYSINTIIEDVLQVVHVKTEDYTVEIYNEVPPDLFIKCIPSQLSQVFLNLFSNSLYEVKKLNEKWISISAEVNKEAILIHFIDSGKGIPQEIKDKLMHSLFTSKPIGEGTGFGLTICKRILKTHGGDLYINERMKNTCFTLKFPIEKLC